MAIFDIHEIDNGVLIEDKHIFKKRDIVIEKRLFGILIRKKTLDLTQTISDEEDSKRKIGYAK